MRKGTRPAMGPGRQLRMGNAGMQLPAGGGIWLKIARPLERVRPRSCVPASCTGLARSGSYFREVKSLNIKAHPQEIRPEGSRFVSCWSAKRPYPFSLRALDTKTVPAAARTRDRQAGGSNGYWHLFIELVVLVMSVVFFVYGSVFDFSYSVSFLFQLVVLAVSCVAFLL